MSSPAPGQGSTFFLQPISGRALHRRFADLARRDRRRRGRGSMAAGPAIRRPSASAARIWAGLIWQPPADSVTGPFLPGL